jgi:hypothetical protein
MFIMEHIDNWDVTRVLVNNNSQAKILFLSAFDQMGYDRKQLKEATKPLYGFGGKELNQSVPYPCQYPSKALKHKK